MAAIEKSIEQRLRLTKGVNMGQKNKYEQTFEPKEVKAVEDLSKEEAEKEAALLRDAVEYHNFRYYVKDKPVISDHRFDQMFGRLQNIEERFPELEDENSPTKRVGGEAPHEFKTVRHRSIMLSLDSAYEADKIKRFCANSKKEAGNQKLSYYLEPKLDGLSIEVVYSEGEFSNGSTRGDGSSGDDISESLKTVPSIPLRLQSNEAPQLISVRGELLMLKDGFQELNKQRIENGLEPFANPRNAASGIVRQLDPKKVAGKPFTVFFYDVLELNGKEIDNHDAMLKYLSALGLQTNHLIKKVSSFEEIKKYFDSLTEQRKKLDYEIDGVVIKADDYEIRRKLGRRERNPRWAIAWKFQPKKEVTTIEDITVQVGRTGMLTPVALLDPVNVGGVTVSRATLHTFDEVQQKDLRRGDKVKVIRAGDVIPEIPERIPEKGRKREEPVSPPSNCPVCGSSVEQEGAYYFCSNGLSCKAQIKGHIVHFASKEAMDIDHLGEKTVNMLVERKMAERLSDIYYLKKEDFSRLEGFAEKSSKQLFDAVQASRRPELDRFVYALGIRHTGRHTARLLAAKFKTLESVMNANKKSLLAIDEVGEQIAESVYSFFNAEGNIDDIKRMKKAGVKVKHYKGGAERTLSGLTFVFTGELQRYSREEAKEEVERRGGRAASSVSGNTDYLVAGENPGSKFDDAKKEKVGTIDEEDFESLLEK